MARTGGEETRKRILKTAEKLFAEKGFDGTSVDRIAAAAKVNKALIYYHFKDKNDLIMSLFTGIVEELGEHLRSAPGAAGDAVKRKQGGSSGTKAARDKIEQELEFLARQKQIISLMLAEALRSDDRDDFLFQCAELVMAQELHDSRLAAGKRKRGGRKALQRLQVFEFFTGFIPLIAFVTLRDKWCDYFGCDRKQLQEHFLEAFASAHLAAHKQSG